MNRKYLDAQNTLVLDENLQLKYWAKGMIGRGQSLICLDGQWTDWADVVDRLQTEDEEASYLAYDNLNIKLYAYPVDEIRELHQLSESESFNGVHARICEDCGYALVER